MGERYGLYLHHSIQPEIIGTEQECRLHIGRLTEQQRQRGWVVTPIPPISAASQVACHPAIPAQTILGMTIMLLALTIAGAMLAN